MDFYLSEEQKMVVQMVGNFTEKEVAPAASGMDRSGEFPKGLVKRLAEMGLMGAFIPAEYGGSGMDHLTYILAMEEISKGWASLGVIMTVNNSLVCDPILRFGTEDQKKRYLVPLAKGEWLGCYALTEPEAGSDAGAVATQAKVVGGEYILNGSKRFITNGKHADIAIAYAVTDPSRGKKGISAFIVETASPGFLVGKIEDKMGLCGSDTAELVFEDCRIPKENLIGAENEGFKIALATLDGGRIGIAAQAVGIAQGCLEAAIHYAKERRQFGRPIAAFQAIQWMIADMKTEIDAARLLTHRAAWRRQRGEAVTAIAAQAKLYASEMANRIAYKAVQIFGGYGYIKEFPVERFFRDARITTLYEGTSEIQRMVIARNLLQTH
ncbi:MAG: acyl-CoA dehydrogenase [Nitrospiria bacterium]